MGYNKDINRDMKKNRPMILPPIINTIISISIMVFITMMKINSSEFTWGQYISFMIILIFFPIVSFFNFYYSKKQKQKMLKGYEHETEEIMKYMKHRADACFKIFDDETKYHVQFEIIEKEREFSYHYDDEKSSLGYPSIDSSMISIGIGFAGVVINKDTNEIEGLAGLLPKSIWLNKHLRTPKPTTKGTLKAVPIGLDLRPKTYLSILKTADSYYDNRTGFLQIGERKINSIDDVVELTEGVMVVLEEKNLKSIWIQVGSGLKSI